ncbi:hypothetical protein HDV05_008099 [Chytridiales sp. JEL 0842]|nr:hypothetical protein HDV05_008099 [Chytridiales sp. JEL 0842]
MLPRNPSFPTLSTIYQPPPPTLGAQSYLFTFAIAALAFCIGVLVGGSESIGGCMAGSGGSLIQSVGGFVAVLMCVVGVAEGVPKVLVTVEERRSRKKETRKMVPPGDELK